MIKDKEKLEESMMNTPNGAYITSRISSIKWENRRKIERIMARLKTEGREMARIEFPFSLTENGPQVYGQELLTLVIKSEKLFDFLNSLLDEINEEIEFYETLFDKLIAKGVEDFNERQKQKSAPKKKQHKK